VNFGTGNDVFTGKLSIRHRAIVPGKVIPLLAGLIALGIIITLFVFLGGPYSSSGGSSIVSSQSAVTSAVTVTSSETTAVMSVEQFGPVVSVDQAIQQVGTNFTLPTYLPNNLALQEIRGETSNSTSKIAAIYSSPSLSTLSNYNQGSMIIFVLKDGTTYYPQPPGGGPVIYQNATVSGQPAWGYDPQTYSPGLGSITWWSKGVHYLILADLPFSVLVQIAQSMKT
jgi:hypothetical protein